MGNIFYLLGKSSSGKDTIYQELLRDTQLNLKKAVLYTTRPIREGEEEGVTYHFVNEAELVRFQNEGSVIEVRSYDTIQGKWYYFTVDDGQFAKDDTILMIGTLESYAKMKEYFGERVIPLYIALDDGERLLRAVKREQQQKKPVYAEVCRRFLADEKDFSKERLKENKIERVFENDLLERCVEEIKQYLRRKME